MNKCIEKICAVVIATITICYSACYSSQNSDNSNKTTSTLPKVSVQPRNLSQKTDFTANAMALLNVTNWGEFDGWLSTVKSMGVDAISVDVWWGNVEKTDNSFDWSYYDNIFSKIKAKQLKIVPILSFHQCGGNVGDDYTVMLPSWVWLKGEDMKYKSEQNKYSSEYISLWADSLIRQDYVDFMNDFETHFTSYSNDFLEINVSCGPSGELRYPSYNSHDAGTGYPTRGAFQGYSDRAKNDFKNWVKSKYKSVTAVQNAWHSNPAITNWSMVNVPGNMNDFWYFSAENTPYGKDLFDWYNDALVQHGKRMMSYAVQAFDASMANVDLGYKVSGIHWRMNDTYHPRAAELDGGLIPKYDIYDIGNGYGYDRIVAVAKSISRKTILHFTCLEMDDKENEGGQYVASLAKTLVFWVGNEAKRQGVTIKGENALAGGIMSDHGWDNIDNATTWSAYNGLTVLRINNITAGTGKTRYEQYIAKYKGQVLPSLYLRGTFNNWLPTTMYKSGNIWIINNVQFGNSSTERFKFDVFCDWSKNYGGNGIEGVALQNGPDIPVPTAKAYDITFNEKTLEYKVTTVAVKKYSVNGVISGYNVSAVTVKATKAKDVCSTQTDNNGSFFLNLENGTYTITPSKSGLAFAPPNKKITVNNANVTNIDFTSTQTTSLNIHFQEFESADSYSIHCWDGLIGDFQTSYEGNFNGNHWWKISIPNPPSTFKFCFANSNGNWDGGNRLFNNQAREIFIKKYDNTVYKTRP